MQSAPAFGQPTRSIEPTDEQIQAAKKAFEDLGGTFTEGGLNAKAFYSGSTRRYSNTDEDLKKIPNVPFAFGLNLGGGGLGYYDKLTDAGLKEIAKLENLSLHLDHARVTFAGVSEIAMRSG
jgi:hypothetical protein